MSSCGILFKIISGSEIKPTNIAKTPKPKVSTNEINIDNTK